MGPFAGAARTCWVCPAGESVGRKGVGYPIGSSHPQSLPPGGRWAGEAGSDEGAIWYPTFPCRKGGLLTVARTGFFSCPVGQPGRPHQSPSVTASPRGSLWVVQPYPKKRPKSGPYMGTVIAQRSPQPLPNAKTSEWERAGHKGGGGRGASPPRLSSGLSRESLDPARDRAGTHVAGANLRRSRRNHLPTANPARPAKLGAAFSRKMRLRPCTNGTRTHFCVSLWRPKGAALRR